MHLCWAVVVSKVSHPLRQSKCNKLCKLYKVVVSAAEQVEREVAALVICLDLVDLAEREDQRVRLHQLIRDHRRRDMRIS